MKALILLLIILSTPIQAKVITINDITAEGAETFCKTLKDGDEVILNSQGGYVIPAYKMAKCIRGKDVLLKVVRAMSSATYIFLASRNTCFDKTVIIGFHSPYMEYEDGTTEGHTKEALRDRLNVLGYWLSTIGYDDVRSLSVVGITMLTPYTSMTILNYENSVSLIGHRYIEGCKK